MRYPVYSKIPAPPFVAVACYRYQVSVSMSKPEEQYILEHSIYSALGILGGNIPKTAEVLCLPEETVTFIANFLRNMDHLDGNYIPKGAFTLSQPKEEPKKWEIFYIFKDALTGTLLPFLADSSVTENIGAVSNNRLHVSLGSEGRKADSEPISILGDFKNPCPPPKPRETEKFLLKILKDWGKLSKEAPDFSVNVNFPGEQALFLCNVSLQRGDNKLMVYIDHGTYSASLTEQLRKNPALSAAFIGEMAPAEKPGEKQIFRETILTLEDRANRIPSKLKILYKNPESSNEEDKRKEAYGDIYGDLFVIYETVLKEYLCGIFPCEERLVKRCPDNSTLAGEYFKDIIEKLGGDVQKGYEGAEDGGAGRKIKKFFSIASQEISLGAIIYYQEKASVALPKLCAMTLLAAKDKPQHPLHRCIKENPKLFFDMQVVKEIRNPLSHGKSSDIKLNISQCKEQVEALKKFLRVMKPSLLAKFDKSAPDSDREYPNIEELNLWAKIRVYKGAGDLMLEGSDTFSSLMHMEEVFHSGEGRAINDMYNALNFALFDARPEAKHNLSGGEVKEKLLKRYGSLPQSLTTVSNSKIEKTLNGSSESLGASFLVFLINFYIPREEAEGLIQFTDTLIRERGHGEGRSVIDSEVLEELRLELYKYVNMIYEITKGGPHE